MSEYYYTNLLAGKRNQRLQITLPSIDEIKGDPALLATKAAPGDDFGYGIADRYRWKNDLTTAFSSEKAKEPYKTVIGGCAYSIPVPGSVPPRPEAISGPVASDKFSGRTEPKDQGNLGYSKGLELNAMILEANKAMNSIFDANQMLSQIPPNISGAQFVLGRNLTAEEISNRSITDNLNYYPSAGHVQKSVTSNQQQHHAASVAAQVASATGVLSGHVGKVLASRSDPFGTPAAPPYVARNIFTGPHSGPQSGANAANAANAASDVKSPTSVSSTYARTVAKHYDWSNFTADDIKEYAILQNFSRSSHYPNRRGAIGTQTYIDYLTSIGETPDTLALYANAASHSVPTFVGHEEKKQQGGTGLSPRSRLDVPLGHINIDTRKLDHGILSVMFKGTKKKPTNMVNTHISHTMKAIVLTYLSGVKPHPQLVALLTDPERALLSRLLKLAHVHNGSGLEKIRPATLSGSNKPRDLMNRLWINLGALSSGADNSSIIPQTRKILNELVSHGILSAAKAEQIKNTYLFN